MKSLLLLPALTVISSLAAGPAMAQPANQTTKVCPVVTSRDIESQFSRFSAAWATLDPDIVTGLFTAEPVLLATVSNTPRSTPASVRDDFVSFLKNKPVGKIDSSTIEIDCNTASRVGASTVTLTDPATAKTRALLVHLPVRGERLENRPLAFLGHAGTHVRWPIARASLRSCRRA